MIGAQKGRFVPTVALVLGLGVLGSFALLPSAAATLQPTAKPAPAPDLSTTPKIKSYLRSLGLNPKRFVIQRGERNYAGPDCPGAAWNCTTAQKVVQMPARAADNDDDDDGGENRFVCRPAGVGTNQATNTCVIVQPGPNSNNTATCDIETHGTGGTITQTCLITQNGRRNTASARQVASLNASGAEQDVVQVISAKQTSSASGGNTIQTAQSALISSGPDSSGEAVKQDVHQLNCVNQDAAGSGPNVARSNQGQALFARKHGAAFDDVVATDIAQNTELVTATCIAPATPFPPFPTGGHDPTDCAVPGASPPKESANACTRIYQESDTGRNTIQLGQLDSLFAEVKNSTGNADIEQGHVIPSQTGTDATLDQKSAGVSNIDFDGLTTQITSINGSGTLGFYDVDQTDTGPRCCAAGHQETNTGNKFDIDGLEVQRLFVDGTVPNPDDGPLPGNGALSQDGAVWGDCVTTGNCTVDINATNNADPDGDPASCSASVCHEQVTCTSFFSEGEGGSCSNAPPDITLRARPR